MSTPALHRISFPTKRNILLLLLSGIFFAGCGSDIIIERTSITWNPAEKIVSARVLNRGFDHTYRDFRVSFTANQPRPLRLEPQIVRIAPGLEVGGAHIISADFKALENRANNYLNNIESVTIVADSEDDINETRETNNSVTIPTPSVPSLPPPQQDKGVSPESRPSSLTP